MEYICRRMLPSDYDDGVMALLKETDGEFFPPLSTRTSTTQKNLVTLENREPSLEPYFGSLKKQAVILATREDAVAGILSFIPRCRKRWETGSTMCSISPPSSSGKNTGEKAYPPPCTKNSCRNSRTGTFLSGHGQKTGGREQLWKNWGSSRLCTSRTTGERAWTRYIIAGRDVDGKFNHLMAGGLS